MSKMLGIKSLYGHQPKKIQSSIMYPTADLYDRSNLLQRRDAALAIENIKYLRLKDGTQDNIETILDIGCGTGNVTELLARELKPKRVIAFDIEPAMINLAQKRPFTPENLAKISYFCGDACDDFEVLSGQLGLSQGSVDLVVSLHVIHQVPEKKNLLENVFRFLKPNGRFYFLITAWHGFCPLEQRLFQSSQWRSVLERWLVYRLGLVTEDELDEETVKRYEPGAGKPNQDSLQKFWHNHCLGVGLAMDSISYSYVDYPFKSVDDFNDQMVSTCHWLKFIPEDNRKREFLASYLQLASSFVSDQIDLQRIRVGDLQKIFKEEVKKASSSEDQLSYIKEKVDENNSVQFRFEYMYATVVGRKPITDVVAN